MQKDIIKQNIMKKSSITQAIKEFLVESLFSSKKAKDDLIKEKKAKSTNPSSVILKKRHFPVSEDKKFRNVTE
jgi:hypothetical protein